MMTMILRWRDKIAEPLDEWQEKIRQQWISLNPRERMVLSILAAIMVLLIAALIIKEGAGFFLRQAGKAENNYKNIERIQRLSDDLLKQRADISRYEMLKTKRGESFKLSSFLEGEASKSGIVISKMAPTKVKAISDYGDEEWVEIQFSKETNLDSLLKFLTRAEEGLGVRLVELSIKPDFANPTNLEVIATVANIKEL
ncbi:MAG: type II secretion system protein M [Deltaproteobacteria bacterium]|nr:type II secretion system protein M [Deltaproteobacteria bacterium]